MSYGTCKHCGCTDNTACNHPDYGPCWWIDREHEICSHCYIQEIKNDPATERQNDSKPTGKEAASR